MILGMKVSIGSLMSMKSTCARGIMMSRTCISETLSAPSMMESASASSRLREYAERKSSTSCSRSLGSRIRSAERRSSRLGRAGSFIRARSFYRVGIGEADAPQYADFARLHLARACFVMMPVAAQVQHAVHHQVRVVRQEAFVLCTRVARDHRMAQHDVADPAVGEAQHVGRACALAEALVEESALAAADDAQRDVARRRGAARPLAQCRGSRHAAARHCILDRDAIPAGCWLRTHR